ncbi:MAG: hemerythrin domain-containing protein [Comamonadaceae bacterium]|nr:hemerythrin domain-containing protein [Comamonadaceae bacterium]
MAILVWNEDYRVGLDEVDQQHQGLVDMINRLDAAISDGEPSDVIVRLLADLKSYTHYHFSTEEHLMRECACEPGAHPAATCASIGISSAPSNSSPAPTTSAVRSSPDRCWSFC